MNGNTKDTESKMDTEPEMDVEDCPECDGSGLIEEEGVPMEEWEHCEECGGVGYIETPVS